MPAHDLSGFNGSVTLPSSIGGAVQSFTVRRQAASKRTDRYGTDKFARMRLGSILISGDITMFLQMASTSTTPNFVNPAPDGAALTLTLETGCTLTGTAVFPDLTVNHNFNDPAIEATQSYSFTGPVTEVWAST